MSNQENPKKSGFEYEGVFISWHLTDKIVDLQLVDHFAKMPPPEFFSLVEDEFDRERTPILSAMIATSLRHYYQNWSSSRIIRYVENMHMGDLDFFDGEEGEPEVEGLPPTMEEPATPSDDEGDTGDSSKKSSEPADTQ